LCFSLLANPPSTPPPQPSPSWEITAKLINIPEGSIRNDPLYRYAAVFKYEIIEQHAGTPLPSPIYIAHYRPHLPRASAADVLHPEIAGTLKQFNKGDHHRLVLRADAKKRFLSGFINDYIDADIVFWAAATDPLPIPRQR